MLVLVPNSLTSHISYMNLELSLVALLGADPERVRSQSLATHTYIGLIHLHVLVMDGKSRSQGCLKRKCSGLLLLPQASLTTYSYRSKLTSSHLNIA